jgi:uroporphyrinogen decarboxylase
MGFRLRSPRMTRRGIRATGNALELPAPLWDSAFLRASRGETPPCPPVWLMRQAGRYMQHYRGVRAGGTFLELCKDPARCAEVAVHARSYLGVDAAIVFSDILIVLEALGLPLEFSEGGGPRLPQPLRAPGQVEALGNPAQAAADLDYVYRAMRLTVDALPQDIPCIGFCGAPFTLGAYAIEGGGSRQFAQTKAFMYRESAAWHRLMETLVAALAPYLNRQIAAGASCIQIFDSWVGELTRADFREFVAPHLTRLIAHVHDGVPVILFGTGTGHLLEELIACGPDVLGVDTTTDLRAAAALAATSGVAVQGNLDPCLLLAPRERLLAQTDALLAQAADASGHIVNLGHGVLKETDPAQAKAFVERVHAAGATRRRA